MVVFNDPFNFDRQSLGHGAAQLGVTSLRSDTLPQILRQTNRTALEGVGNHIWAWGSLIYECYLPRDKNEKVATLEDKSDPLDETSKEGVSRIETTADLNSLRDPVHCTRKLCLSILSDLKEQVSLNFTNELARSSAQHFMSDIFPDLANQVIKLSEISRVYADSLRPIIALIPVNKSEVVHQPLVMLGKLQELLFDLNKNSNLLVAALKDISEDHSNDRQLSSSLFRTIRDVCISQVAKLSSDMEKIGHICS